MAKSLSGLWLRSLRSISKTQRAQSRLMKSLLPKPARSPTVRKTPAQLAKPPEGLAKAAKSARKPATQTAPDFATATRMNQLAERKGFAVLSPTRITRAESRSWCSATSARWATRGVAATTASASVHAKGRTHR